MKFIQQLIETHKRKKEIAQMIYEMNEMALLRHKHKLSNGSMVGKKANSLFASVEVKFENQLYKLISSNIFEDKFKLLVKVEDDWVLLAEYDSSKDKEIVWSQYEKTNIIAKRLISEYMAITEKEVKEREDKLTQLLA